MNLIPCSLKYRFRCTDSVCRYSLKVIAFNSLASTRSDNCSRYPLIASLTSIPFLLLFRNLPVLRGSLLSVNRYAPPIPLSCSAALPLKRASEMKSGCWTYSLISSLDARSNRISLGSGTLSLSLV